VGSPATPEATPAEIECDDDDDDDDAIYVYTKSTSGMIS